MTMIINIKGISSKFLLLRQKPPEGASERSELRPTNRKIPPRVEPSTRPLLKLIGSKEGRKF